MIFIMIYRKPPTFIFWSLENLVKTKIDTMKERLVPDALHSQHYICKMWQTINL